MLYHIAIAIHKGTHSDGEHAVLIGFSDYCMLYTSDHNVDDNPLIGLICERLHFESLNHRHRSQDHHWEWWKGICFGASAFIGT